jgi:hypothetical protein
MKPFFTILCVSLLLASCLSEKSVDPAAASTFVRYYYGGYNDKAAAFEETPDKGFILLSTVTITASEAVAAKYKVKLIKTDEFGNPQWQKVYPDFTAASTNIDYKAKGLQILQNGGYVITGEYIQTDPNTKVVTTSVLIITFDDAGNLLKTTSVSPGTTASVSGQAVAANSVGNYLVLSNSATVNSSGDTEMFLGEMKKDDLSTLWGKDYSAGAAVLAPRLYLDGSGKVFWAGTVTRNGLTGIRVVKTGQNVQNSDFDLMLINPPFADEATDFCRFGNGYAIIGSTNQKSGSGTPADKDILFKRLAQDGTPLQTKSFPLDDPDKGLVDAQNDIGNSISSTRDGGLILLASVGSLAIQGRGDNDYLLIHIDAFGTKVWTSNFGSKFKDQGVAVRQTSDGGYAVLGTTTQGGREIMMLAKTNATGTIE